MFDMFDRTFPSIPLDWINYKITRCKFTQKPRVANMHMRM